MDRNFAEALKLVLKHEGGWSDHPADNGGATMRGVTLANYRRFINTTGTKKDLRNITDLQLQQVYREQYWNKVRGNDLPAGVDYCFFDYAVHSGHGRACKELQRILGVTVDGQIGPQTLAAARKLPATQIINATCDKRMKFLRGLEDWPVFGKGWKSRVDGVRAEALKMASTAPKPSVPKASEPVSAPPSTTPPSPPATTPAAPTGWLSLILSLFRKGA